MKITREEIIRLAMRADMNDQHTLADNLRDVAAFMDENRVHTLPLAAITWEIVDKVEKQMLLDIGDY